MMSVLIILLALIYSFTIVVLFKRLEKYINYYRTEQEVSEKLRDDDNRHMAAYMKKLTEQKHILEIVNSDELLTAADIKKEILLTLGNPSNTSKPI